MEEDASTVLATGEEVPDVDVPEAAPAAAPPDTAPSGTAPPDTAAPGTEVAGLLAEVAELESLPRFDRDAAGERAQRATARARELGLTELELRAQLVRAEVFQRRGELAAAGRLAQEVQQWASDHDARHLLARSHYVLQNVFLDLGDLSLALEHSVRAVELMDAGTPAPLRFDHLGRLADCLGLNGDIAAARERHPQVLRLAEELGDVDRQLVALNNRAYVEALHGDLDVSLRFCTRMRELAGAHRRALHVGRLDTVARTLLGLGRLAEAEEVLLPVLEPGFRRASPDGDAGADSLLTLAEVRRRRGRLDQAQAALDTCVRTCEELGLGTVRVHARREQAEIHAAAGRFREAFEEHKGYTHDVLQLQSDQRDARARAIQAMYETGEARRQSRRYRELSLRDPLTGLYNRRYVDEELPRLLRVGAGRGTPVTVALLDLDHFKRVNDTLSHDVGDRVLATVAELLETAADQVDGAFAARLGGEEFLLVLPGPEPAAARDRLEQVRRTIRSHPWAAVTADVPVTVSIGATHTGAVVPCDPAAALRRADTHLYRAKRTGRDRVVSDPG
jgi:two-component system, cell cycle response regulator